MMPTPTVHQFLGESVFDPMAEEERSPGIKVFYATNRPPDEAENSSLVYTNGSVDYLSLGEATVHFGDRRMTWRDLLTLSIRKERDGKIPLKLEGATEMGELPGTDAIRFADQINETLKKREDKQLTIYVHGANSSFFKACVQGAQFYHFMRREGVMLSLSWPSTGKFLKYHEDVQYAEASVTHFADLVECLAANTDAEKINVLAYSAGAQVVAPGLAELRERHKGKSDNSLKRDLRIGVAYFAAPDISLVKFTNTYLPKFYQIVDNTTVTFHRKDGVLNLATTAHKESRLGRPDESELTDEEIAFLEKAARAEQLDAIDMQYAPKKRPLNFRAHGHWYTNEWVSSDVIIQLLLHLRPEQRGLKRKPGKESYYFPADYPETLKRLIKESRGEN